jgi:hypothetical protein
VPVFLHELGIQLQEAYMDGGLAVCNTFLEVNLQNEKRDNYYVSFADEDLFL